MQTNWRTRLHELLYLEEAQQAKLTRAYDLHAVSMEQVTEPDPEPEPEPEPSLWSR